MKYVQLITAFILTAVSISAQKLLPFKLSDTGQNTSYTSTPGEDADFVVNPLSFKDNGDGTITDNNSLLMWQKTDAGEMTYEKAQTYADTMLLGGYSDWRLPTAQELFGIHLFENNNPALNTTYFPKTLAEYWWSKDRQADNAAVIWATNAGGGVGNHPKTETLSAGGSRRFHLRAVRSLVGTMFSVTHFTDNGDGTIQDNYTGLTWQKFAPTTPMTWEAALEYAKSVTLGGKWDWRLPNIKELQSLNDVSRVKPSINKTFFPNIVTSAFYRSSTTQYKTPAIAWDLNTDYGVVTYNEKSLNEYVILVRGGTDNVGLGITDLLIPGGTFSMGDHIGFVDPKHPSDELPLHDVAIDSFYLAKTHVTNQQYLAYLNAAFASGLIRVRNNIVYGTGLDSIYCYTNKYASYYSIAFDGKVFSIADFRENHPMVGVRWSGAVAFCNWLSALNGLNACYDLSSGMCDFSQNGYRLPTEAEWEYAARGGQYNPYYNYPWGNNTDGDKSHANWSGSGDPYESTDVNAYPFTTPVGFYDGSLKQKSDFNWPGSATTYQTANSTNGFGLVDMAGNVWQFVNDWYTANYYSSSPFSNPKGPDAGSAMPDGKAYKGMRGGNWYNGDIVNGIDDGHSRVSNRNPSYFRGPQDPNHPWYHVGFRVCRNFAKTATGLKNKPVEMPLVCFPNPFRSTANIRFSLTKPDKVSVRIYNSLGQLVETLAENLFEPGVHSIQWKPGKALPGMYSCILQTETSLFNQKILFLKP